MVVNSAPQVGCPEKEFKETFWGQMDQKIRGFAKLNKHFVCIIIIIIIIIYLRNEDTVMKVRSWTQVF